MNVKLIHFSFQFRLWGGNKTQVTPYHLIPSLGGLGGLMNLNHPVVGFSVVRERD